MCTIHNRVGSKIFYFFDLIVFLHIKNDISEHRLFNENFLLFYYSFAGRQLFQKHPAYQYICEILSAKIPINKIIYYHLIFMYYIYRHVVVTSMPSSRYSTHPHISYKLETIVQLRNLFISFVYSYTKRI